MSLINRQKKTLLGLLAVVMVTAGFPRILFGWGALFGAQSHQYILKQAYNKLKNDSAFKGTKFPTLDEILANEGVNWVMSLFEGGFLTGPGPDSKGNSDFSMHYYNPRTGKGEAPNQAAKLYDSLKQALANRDRIQETTTIGAVVERVAAYLAHFVADMSVPYHINGIPAAEAQSKLASGDGMLDEDIVGPTGKGPEDWTSQLEAWAKYYKANPDADWFDPWYWDGWLAADKTSTHLKWEGNYGPTWVGSAEQLTGYSTGFNQSRGNGNEENVKQFVIWAAQYTKSLQAQLWGFKANQAVKQAYDQAITNVYTIWRASFSALRPDVYIERDPQTGASKLVVVVENLEDTEEAKNVEVKVSVMRGNLVKGPFSHRIPVINPKSKVEIKDFWEVEATDKLPKVSVEVTGQFSLTPDSGFSVVEKKLKLLIPTAVHVIPSLVDEKNRAWKLEVEVKDNKGNSVTEGEAHFLASGGSFAPRTVVLDWQKVLEGGKTIKAWMETDNKRQTISVTYLGDKADPQVEDEKYQESTVSLQIPPEVLEMSTVFVIDASGSMRGAKLAAAKDAVRSALTQYQAQQNKDEWALFAFFGCGSCRLLQPFTTDPSQVLTKLGFDAAGSTPIAYSLKMASNYLRSSARGKRGRIILLSDGGENCQGNPVEAAASITTKKILFDLKTN